MIRERIGFGARAWAYSIDSSIAVALAAAFSVGCAYLGIIAWPDLLALALEENASASDQVYLTWSALFFGVQVLYFSIEVFSGATAAKLMYGWRNASIRGSAGAGSVLSLQQALSRFFWKNTPLIFGFLASIYPLGIIVSISSIVALLSPIGYLLALGSKKQAFHDLVSGTAVFES